MDLQPRTPDDAYTPHLDSGAASGGSGLDDRPDAASSSSGLSSPNLSSSGHAQAGHAQLSNAITPPALPDFDVNTWRDLMAYLRQHHTPICRQWFENLRPLELNAGLLVIHAGNEVSEKYLQTKCVDQFCEAAQAVTGALVAVRFTSHGPQPAELPERPRHPRRTTTPRPASQATPIQPSSAWHDAFKASHAPKVTPPWRQQDNAPGRLDASLLSPDYTFDSFIQGPNNDLAAAASLAVADNPGYAYNPLFIHGGVGLGKTHLLQAICQRILDARPDFRIAYVSCDAFINEFIASVSKGQMDQFRHHYRDADMLVIDDIHFLAGKDRTQEEFFHTFNELYQTHRQIVLSSDAAPSEIPELEERLVSRFNWGLVAQVQKPGFETRVAILRAKARIREVQLNPDVLNLLATKISTNARELEGAVVTLQAHSQLHGQEISVDLVARALGENFDKPRTTRIGLTDITDVVTKAFQVKLSDLQSKRKPKSIAEPRQICMWLARQMTRFSLEEIGGFFGGRDHTTVMHAISKIDQMREQDIAFATLTEQLQADIIKSVDHG